MVEVRQTDVFIEWFAGLRDREARARIAIPHPPPIAR
jgi:putative component of toxin-antitoxin plasmid stabilization module